MRHVYVMRKLSAQPPDVVFPGLHVYKESLEQSVLPKEWKKLFHNVLTAREEVLMAVPNQKNLSNMRAIKNLTFKRGPFIKMVRHLMDAVKSVYPDADWPEYEEGFRKLVTYEFMMNPSLAFEVSDWVFNVHSLISALYTLMVNRIRAEGTQISMNTSSLARRVAFRFARTNTAARLAAIARRVSKVAAGTMHLRDSMMHVEPGEVEESSLEQELKTAFLNAFEVKKAFQKLIPMDPKLIDDRATDKLDGKARSLVFAIEGLADKVSGAGKDVDGKTKSALKQLDEHGFVPSPSVSREINDWMWDAHEVISKLFDIATDKVDD